MRPIRFLPLAFVADVHGFVLFAPYLLLVIMVALVAHEWSRRRARLRVPAVAAVSDSTTGRPVVALSEVCEPCTLDTLDAALAAVT